MNRRIPVRQPGEDDREDEGGEADNGLDQLVSQCTCSTCEKQTMDPHPAHIVCLRRDGGRERLGAGQSVNSALPVPRLAAHVDRGLIARPGRPRKNSS
jgi:hypothetical protein